MQRRMNQIARGCLALPLVTTLWISVGTSARACNVPKPGPPTSFVVPNLASLVEEAAQPPIIGTSTDATNSRTEAAAGRPGYGGWPVPAWPTIAGLWLITFTSGGQTVDTGFDSWHSDGTEILNDTPAPATGNVCLGVWVQTGARTYKLKHPSWTFDDSGNLTGTAVISETVTLSAAGTQFTGTYTIAFYDNAGNSQGSFSGTVSANRITPG